jgi:hypothetical protein
MSAVPTITESPGASPAASTTAPPEPPRPTWTICDGCNNSFLVWPNRFLYKPITPIESSSGACFAEPLEEQLP